MPVDRSLEAALDTISRTAPPPPDDFMERVWERVGDMAARRGRKKRLVLFVGLFGVGIGAGIGTVRSPLHSPDRRYALAPETLLSPAALLHVTP